MAMDTDAIPNFLAELRDDADDESQEYYIKFEDFWERKLWHELTDVLIEYFDQPESASQRIRLYDTFIRNFAGKINQLKLVRLGLAAATQVKGMV
jgi:26S proteasome regulatory subunit N9